MVAYVPTLNDDDEKSGTRHGPDSHGELTTAFHSMKHRQQNSQGTDIDSKTITLIPGLKRCHEFIPLKDRLEKPRNTYTYFGINRFHFP